MTLKKNTVGGIDIDIMCWMLTYPRVERRISILEGELREMRSSLYAMSRYMDASVRSGRMPGIPDAVVARKRSAIVPDRWNTTQSK